MFTSEPSLTQRIERMIGDVRIVDTRSNLAVDRLGATDLATLLVEPPLRVALEGVGMPAEAFDPGRSADERVMLALPFLRQIRNTAPAWCLFRIFRDLHDFDEPHLTLDNYQGLMDRVTRSASDPEWPRHVIQHRANINTLVVPLLHPLDGAEVAEVLPDVIVYRLEVVANQDDPATLEGVRSRVFEELDVQLEGRVRCVAFPKPPNVANPVHAAVLEWHNLHHWPIQVVFDQHSSSLHWEQVESAILQYPNARFGLMTGSSDFGPRLAILAGRFPNVFAEGFCGAGAWPMMIEQNVLARVQQAGATKLGGFASGATTAEWVYGSLQATKKATASALAQAVSGGFFEEEEIPPLVRGLFHTSPLEWYHLRD